jgi:hypothetical protein
MSNWETIFEEMISDWDSKLEELEEDIQKRTAQQKMRQSRGARRGSKKGKAKRKSSERKNKAKAIPANLGIKAVRKVKDQVAKGLSKGKYSDYSSAPATVQNKVNNLVINKNGPELSDKEKDIISKGKDKFNKKIQFKRIKTLKGKYRQMAMKWAREQIGGGDEDDTAKTDKIVQLVQQQADKV